MSCSKFESLTASNNSLRPRAANQAEKADLRTTAGQSFIREIRGTSNDCRGITEKTLFLAAETEYRRIVIISTFHQVA